MLTFEKLSTCTFSLSLFSTNYKDEWEMAWGGGVVWEEVKWLGMCVCVRQWSVCKSWWVGGGREVRGMCEHLHIYMFNILHVYTFHIEVHMKIYQDINISTWIHRYIYIHTYLYVFVYARVDELVACEKTRVTCVCIYTYVYIFK